MCNLPHGGTESRTVFVLFAATRSAVVLAVYFGWLRGKSVTYDGFLDILRR